jgi:type VII secretion protein EccB
MQSRRDHLQAYNFSVSRLTTALTAGDTGTGEAPFRRSGLGTVFGVMIGVLLSAGAIVFGLLDPAPSTAWRQQGAIVVEKETGTRFLYLDGALHPTVNYTSAMLVAGSGAAVNYVPAKTLAAVPQGPAVGIAGAPDSLPPATALLPGRWAVCVYPDRPGAAGLDLAPGQAAGAALTDQRILVISPHGVYFVIWNNVRYPLRTRSALVALGLSNQVPIRVSAAWLAELPAGPALARLPIARAGRAGPRVAGEPPGLVGQLYDSTSAGVDQYYVLLPRGLAPISHTEFVLSAAAPHARPPVQVTPADIAASRAAPNHTLLGRLPDLVTGAAYQPSAAALCVRQASPGAVTSSAVVSLSVAGQGVIVPSGAGMIATTPAVSAADSPPVYLIAGTGVKYLLGENAEQALGYGSVTAQVLPAEILSLVPNGPVLAAAAAKKAVSWESS